MDTSELSICTDGLTECQINKGKELIQSYTDIMSQDDLDIGHTPSFDTERYSMSKESATVWWFH
jgi:hypothetical protein